MRFKEKTVQLNCIDLNDETYRITTRTHIDDLIDSIKEVGVINSPLLVEKKSSLRAQRNLKFAVVCGFRRVAACQHLGWLNLKARIIDSDTERVECVKLAIIDNALQRPLNLIEKSRSLQMLSGFFKDDIKLSRAVSALGLPENLSVIKKIKNIYHLSPFIQNCIFSNSISLSVAVELGAFEQDAGVMFARLFDDLKLSLSKQREIVTLVKEIALRDDICIKEVFKDNDFQRILNSGELDRTQKSQRVRSYLKQRRFPAITVAKKRFEKQVEKLRLKGGIRLIPPDNFEGSTYMLKLCFNNLKQLKDRKAILDKAIQNHIFESILD